ncbi:MAG: hypothetical protein K0R25_1215 [Rickettsiaceae bacterium]|jgi:hypothetical protein|nr:hypothetical protein [Rickettsiaceae bacterium]
MLTTQIGKAGELLVQYKLLLKGIESAQLTTDSGIDLVAYSAKSKKSFTIQVKTNLQPKKGGGKGKLALDWYLRADSPADLVALVDLESERIWLMTLEQISGLAQQKSSSNVLHIYLYTQKTTSKKRTHDFEFSDYLFEDQVLKIGLI